MRKKIVILLIFISVFFLNASFSEAVSTCKPGYKCSDNQTDSCKYCSESNKYSGGAGYVKGGILEGICDIRNTSDCEMDAACWTSSGVFSSTAGSQSATAVDCCKTADCPTGGSIGYICQNNKCVDWGLGTIDHTTPIVKPTAIMEDPTATSITGKGTTTNGAKITKIKIYKDTSGCGGDPRVHLDGCTGTGLFDGAPVSQSGNIWSATFNFAGTATKETKYSVKVQDDKNNWSNCVSKIFATTTGADPASGFTTGVDTSKGGNVFTCSGFEPNGTTKIMCPESESKKSAVQNSWTSVGTSESDCGDMARCEYYTVGVTNNPVISPNPSDPTAPSCTATGTGNNPINSGDSFPVKLTVKNANSIKWLCSNFNCTNNSTCNYERDYTVENTLSMDELDSTGSISATMVYNNTDSSLKIRRCTFYVSNSTTGKTGECTNSVAVRPKESVANATNCGEANELAFSSEATYADNKLGGKSLCKDNVPIVSPGPTPWVETSDNRYSKQTTWKCGGGIDVNDCKAYLEKPAEDVDNGDGAVVDAGISGGGIGISLVDLCGTASGNKQKEVYGKDLGGKPLTGLFLCSDKANPEVSPSSALPTTYPAMGSGEVSWWCVDKNDSTKRIKCAMEVNGNGSPQSEVATVKNVICNEGSIGSCSASSGSSTSIGDFSRNDCKIACEKQLTSAGCFISLAGTATTATAPCYCKAGGQTASPAQNGGILFFGGNCSYDSSATTTPVTTDSISDNAGTSTPYSNDTTDTVANNVSNSISDATIPSNSEPCGSYAKIWGATEQWPNRTTLINTLGGLCNISKGYTYHTLPETEPTSSNPVTWKCYLSGTGLEGLTTCTAKRSGDTTTDVARAKEDTQGKCGTASRYYNPKKYSDWVPGLTFCEKGVPEFYNEEPVVTTITDYRDSSQFPFPVLGVRGRTKWTCIGTEHNSGLCIASVIYHEESAWKTVADVGKKAVITAAVVTAATFIPGVAPAILAVTDAIGTTVMSGITYAKDAYMYYNTAGDAANVIHGGY